MIFNRVVRAIIAVLLVSSVSFLAFGQQPSKDQIIKSLQTFDKQFPQEKVYLQTDRDYYVAGETVWFSAYIRYQEKPTTLSKLLHVVLEDKDGKRLVQVIVPIVTGHAGGHILLPSTLSSGNFRIVAFSSWMLNFDPAFLFHKDIVVWNDTTELISIHTTEDKDYEVNFFPEGGNLVAGLQSTVAFKAETQNGLPLVISGQIVDASNNIVATMHTVHDGMGSFSLVPGEGERYEAIVHFPDQTIKRYYLPDALYSGIVMHVSNRQLTEQKIYVGLRQKPLNADSNLSVLLVIKSGQKVFTPTITFQGNEAAIAIPTALLSSGVTYITVFDVAGFPLAERLIFVRKESDILPLSIQAVQVSAKKRKKNEFVLKAPGAEEGHFSVAVTDADLISSFTQENNILSYMMMASDIKGNVYHPGWYFEELDTTHLQALDLVMKTNGWSRFVWKEILNDNFIKISYPLEQNQMLYGQVLYNRHKKEGNPITDAVVEMDIVAPGDSLHKTYTFKTDSVGKFALNLLPFHDSATFYFLKVTDPKGKHPECRIHLFNYPDSATLPHPTFRIHKEKKKLEAFVTAATEQRENFKKIQDSAILLKAVVIKGLKKTHLDSMNEKYASSLFTQPGEMAFDIGRAAESKMGMTVLDFIQFNIPGINVMGDSILYWRMTTGMNQSTLKQMALANTPAIFIDEVPVYSSGDGGGNAALAVARLSDLLLSKVALIKVFRVGFVGSAGGSPHGAIAVYLKRGGDEVNFKAHENALVAYKQGYALVKEFYSPDYSKQNKEVMPDKRLTLNWNPNLQTNNSGEAYFSFYNNDITHKFRVIIEGMDSTGKIGRIEKIFTPAELNNKKVK